MNARDILTKNSVIPIITISHLNSSVVDLALALIEGGITTLEITLRTPAGIEAIRQLKKEIPAAIIGAGTVINANQLHAVIDAGAAFAISPGINSHFAKAASSSPIPVIPGVATAGEIMLALEHGLDTLKLFPAQTIGGFNIFKAFYGPFPNVQFCASGGITPHNASEYLALPNVLCVGASWLTPQDLITNRDWTAITQLAQTAAALKNNQVA